MKKSQLLLLLVCTLLLGWFVAHNWAMLPKLAFAVRQGERVWLAVAVLAQIATLGFLTAIYQKAFYVVGADQPFRALLPQSLAAIFIDSTAPAGGAAGAAIMIDAAERRQALGARTAAGMLLYYVANYGVYVLLLLTALLLMTARSQLSATIMSMSLTIVATTVILCLLLLLAARFRGGLTWLLGFVQAVVNRALRLFGRNSILSNSWVERQSADFVTAAATMTKRPGRLLQLLCASLLMHLSAIAVFAAILAAFQQQTSLPILLIGYAMHILFTNVSPTPNGIGVVEIALPPIMQTLGMTLSAGLTVTLVFRAFTFWLPLSIGFIAIRSLQKSSNETN